MGSLKSKNPILLTSKQMTYLQNQTKMSKDEINFFHREFIAHHPGGFLTEEQFFKVFQRLFKYEPPEHVAKLAFRLFDRDKNGRITFDEFLVMSAFLYRDDPHHYANSLRQDLELFDGQQSMLDRDEVEFAVFAFYRPEGYDSERCKRISQEIMGENSRVSQEVFLKHVLQDDLIKKKYSLASE